MSLSGEKWVKVEFFGLHNNKSGETDVFRGVQHINMDAKGRMAMPTKHRDAFNLTDNGQLIATIDINSRCILIYPLSTWEEIEKKFLNVPGLSKSARRVQRLIIGNATDLEMDGNGRILLSPSLRKYAGLEKKVVLVGMNNKLELWDEEAYLAEEEQAIEDANNGNLDLPEDLQHLVL